MSLRLITALAVLPLSGWAAIAHVADDTCQMSSSSNDFTTAALSTNPTAGNTLLIGIRLGGTNSPTWTITSTPSSTWTQEGTTSGSPISAIFRSNNVGGGSTTIRIQTGVAVNSIRVCMMEISGLANPSGDQNAQASFSASMSQSSGATGTRTVANELIFGLYIDQNTTVGTVSAGSTYTIGSNGNGVCTSTNVCIALEYKIVSMTGTDACTFTTSVNQTGNVLCATEKASAAAAAPTNVSVIVVGP